MEKTKQKTVTIAVLQCRKGFKALVSNLCFFFHRSSIQRASCERRKSLCLVSKVKYLKKKTQTKAIILLQWLCSSVCLSSGNKKPVSLGPGSGHFELEPLPHQASFASFLCRLFCSLALSHGLRHTHHSASCCLRTSVSLSLSDSGCLRPLGIRTFTWRNKQLP